MSSIQRKGLAFLVVKSILGPGRIPFGEASDGVFVLNTCTIAQLAFSYFEQEQ
jgi:hypothetical protein